MPNLVQNSSNSNILLYQNPNFTAALKKPETAVGVALTIGGGVSSMIGLMERQKLNALVREAGTKKLIGGLSALVGGIVFLWLGHQKAKKDL